MFSLLYGLWEYVWRKEELRILILGLDKAGKTSLLEKLKVGSLTAPVQLCMPLGSSGVNVHPMHLLCPSI